MIASAPQQDKNYSCALCGTLPVDEDSHIVPSFIIRWIKKTSATGYLRGTKEPNQRLQDGLKYPLLCKVCEDRFAEYESSFAREIFHPYAQSQKTGMLYGSYCLKFFVSLVWRALHHLWLHKSSEETPMQPEFSGRLEEPYSRWREFLLDESEHPQGFTVNVIPVDDVFRSTVPNTPKRPSQYNTGAVDMDLVCDSKSGFVYVKIPYFWVFGKIFAHRDDLFSKNTLIRRQKGQLGGLNMSMPRSILEYVHSRSVLVEQASQAMSLKQLETIKRAVEQNPERVLASRSVKSAMLDERLRVDG
jgi:hypothetical protein